MRVRCLLLSALLLVATPLVAQPPQRLIAALPVCDAEMMHWAALWVTDAQNSQDCTQGGGTERAYCRCNGSWTPVLLQGPPGPPASPCNVWPVDSIFISVGDSSPAVTLGCGMWEPFASGRVLVAVDGNQGEFNVVGETGGVKAHALTEAEMPSHTHAQDQHSHSVTDPGHTHLTQRYPTATGSSSGFTIDTSMSGTVADNTLPVKAGTTGVGVNATTATNQTTGGGVAHTNLQPYIVVRMWRRLS